MLATDQRPMPARRFAWVLRALPFTTLAVALGCAPEPAAPEQRCAALLAGDLVLSEIMPDPPGADTGHEYIELFNARAESVDLEGLSLVSAAHDGSSERRAVLAAAAIPAGGYFVLGDARSEPKPAYVDYAYGSRLGALGSSSGKIALRCGERVLDEVVYDQVTPGHARELDGAQPPDSIVNDDPGHWCDAVTPLADASGGFGTPGTANTSCVRQAAGTCRDDASGAARPIALPAEGDLLISEWLADPAASSDAAGEWFELYARRDADLAGLRVRSGPSAVTLPAATCLHVAAGQYALIARSSDALANGGLPAVTASVNLALANGAGFLSIESDTTVIDEVDWPGAHSGVAWQLSASALDAERDARAAAYCAATRPYGQGDLGTPGAPNELCPVVVGPDECVDADSGLGRAIQRPNPGDLLISELMPHPGHALDADGEWFEVSARAEVDLNGLELAGDSGSRTTLSAVECLRTQAGSQVLFARKLDPAVNGGLPPVLSSFGFALANSGTRSVTLSSGGVLIDRVSYASVQQGVSLQLSSRAFDPALSADPTHWCFSPLDRSYGLGDHGTPGASNVACPEPGASGSGAGGNGGAGGASSNGGAGGAAGGSGGASGAAGSPADAGVPDGAGASPADAGAPDGAPELPPGFCLDAATGTARATVPPGAGELVISEVMAAPSVGNGAAGEWFELWTRASFDLNGLVLGNEGAGNLTLSSVECLTVPFARALLFARSADAASNGELPPVDFVFTFGLADSASTTFAERALVLRSGDSELDRVSWTRSTRGVALQRSGDQLDSAGLDAPLWCAAPAEASFGNSERGTPGARNPACL